MTTSTEGRNTTSGAGPVSRSETSAPLDTSHGTTTIASTVVQKIAGLAAREIHGVYDLGGGMTRAFGAIRDRIPGANASAGQGVSVEVGEKQAAVDLDVVVEYGVAIPDVARSVRTNTITAIEQMTGLEVVEVNVAVNDMHLPGDDEDTAPASGRVE